MSVIREEESRNETLVCVAKKMMAAARTAPKGRGTDNLAIAMLDKDGIRELSEKMKEMAEEKGAPDFFRRDAQCILSAEALVLIGTRIDPCHVPYCGLCGFGNCEEKQKHPDHPCAFNTGDLGIAVGSAVSIAMEHRVDNRIMFSIGIAAREMKLLGGDTRIIYGIPLSCTSKNPFFDRVWPK
jgi:uncharacterized ferredoxin-like protein